MTAAAVTNPMPHHLAKQAELIRRHAFGQKPPPQANNGTANFKPVGNYMQYAEIERIVALPVSGQMDEAELEEFSRANILAEAFNDGFRFFPEQAEAISAYELTRGGFFVVPVGFGKTLASLVIADKAYRKGIDRMTLHVPAQVMAQLTITDIRWARTRVPLSVPIHVLGGKSLKQRHMLAKSGKRGLYVMPYSLLSAKDAEETLWAIEPGLVILDEGHNVARRSSSARAKRMTNYLEKTRCECVVLSGTITAKSVMDYWHLIKNALKDNNPLPNSAHLANEWGGIIDATAEGDQPVTTNSAGPMMPLVHWARKWFGKTRTIAKEKPMCKEDVIDTLVQVFHKSAVSLVRDDGEVFLLEPYSEDTADKIRASRRQSKAGESRLTMLGDESTWPELHPDFFDDFLDDFLGTCKSIGVIPDPEESSVTAAYPGVGLCDSLMSARWGNRWSVTIEGEKFDESVAGFRRAYKRRLRSTAGVVASDREIGTSLILRNEPIKGYKKVEGRERLEELIKQVEEQWITPNGDEIEHAIHTWKWLNELTVGFYNELTWPTPGVLAERRGIGEREAEDILEKAKKHHAEGQEYHRMLRKFLEGDYPQKPRQGMDTPMLVGNDMARHGDDNVPSEMYEQWCLWKALDFEGRPERDSNAIRVCPYKVEEAAEWAMGLNGEGGIVWVHHQEIGKWVVDLLTEQDMGDRVLHCPAGAAANKAILDHDNKNKVIVASMTAHGTGKNLQHFQHQYFLQWPRDSRMAEQVIGRTHRSGQMADELVVRMCLTTEFDYLNFAACLNDSLYIQQTTGNRQKIIYATYDPQPKIFPSAVLLERGLQVKRLNEKQQKEMTEKFG